ncbi:hypothetical protein ARMSODRAFT_1088582 [Armillaria solidipes]|uniref:Uncharacterized protein n=1 Tax=Armillaria solidipes TaxID=1076256 RepID=A0A2H3B949_9AGAR|nr:hypothetical protein ARMSODRAFT_1088582 [Armillaria solidipes]
MGNMVAKTLVFTRAEYLEGTMNPLFWKGWWASYYKNPLVLADLKRRQSSRDYTLRLRGYDETGQANIPVLGQQSYTGKQPAITSSLANTPCADLGVDEILKNLNATLGTSYTLEKPSNLEPALKSFIERNEDFGMAYAHILS